MKFPHRISSIPRPARYKYDPKNTDLTAEQISERIADLLVHKRILEGTHNVTKPEIAFIDIETTGLSKGVNIILEVGLALTDLSLQKIDTFSMIVSDDLVIQHLDWLKHMAEQEPNFRGQEPWSGAKYVYEMHQKNGLDAEIRATHAAGEKHTLAKVAHTAADWLRSYNVHPQGHHLPMTGSSVMFDRGFVETQMDTLNSMFHYRNTDISSLKNLVDKYRADLVEKRRKELQPVGAHRSLSDIDDSIEELKFYLENLFRKDL